ncbi:MAG: 50S ribosomal protein L25, partial [Nocardiopsaceae bacterium]|nr:50S ribosomal protein L25 [Nocardiopsaceae bacterium]
VDVDVEGMEVGAAVHAGDLTLPAGTTLAGDPEALVLHVVAERTAPAEDEEAEGEEAADEAAEGE